MALHIRGRYSSPVGPGALTSLSNGRVGRHCPVSTARTMPSKKTVRLGTKAKPLAVGANSAGGFAVPEAAFLCCASHSATSNSGPFTERLTRPLPNCRPKVGHAPQKCLSQTCIVGGKGKAAGSGRAGGFAVSGQLGNLGAKKTYGGGTTLWHYR